MLWDMPGVPQRENMLTDLTLGALPHVATPWHVKLDTDAVAFAGAEWPLEEWFGPDEDGRFPAFIASPWGYTKPAKWLAGLNDWEGSVPELRGRAEVSRTPSGDGKFASHHRITSWFFLGNTAWCRRLPS